MKKIEIIKELADKQGITQVDSKKLFDTAFDELSEILAEGRTVNIQGFGTFSVREVSERKGFNPLREKWMMLPKKLRVHFKASDILKERVNKK